uniref:Pectinesterase inhibitor n=1 Tax=Cajanus cajan TaxID=3821 RepID=A0A151RV57_CAJCA|nr:Pectinesterase inhibitor [Cajanus cajan]
MHSFVKHPLLLVPLLCFLFSLCSARTVTISDICSKHNNPNSCDKILNTIPGASLGVDIGSLSSYIINEAHVNAFNSLTLIHNIIANSTDTQFKLRYNSCSLDYNDVLDVFTQAKQSFTSGKFDAMKSNGAAVIKDVQDCDTKAYDSPQLRMNNQDLGDVSMIIMILADFLAGKF